ncbi:MAG: D-alanyl-D-alanine carboxypeptidase [Candidatus Melainabacteria bacterium]|nr:D-alanyl-D-alanine carboxypeptidase [Candidatus Melainabacteria bacterium]
METSSAKRISIVISLIMMVSGMSPCGAATAAPQTLEGVLGGWLKQQTLQHSNVGVEVMELPSGKVLYSYNGHKRFVPASTAKVFTTACAFETLGGSYTYKTQLLSAGTTTEGKLHGDLVINPSQDPSLSRDDIRQLVAKIDTKKLHSVDGRVRLAKTPGGFEQYLPGWLVEDFGQIYMPVCSNFVVDHNIAQGVSAMKGMRVFDMSSTYEINALTRSLMKADVASAWLTYDPGNKTIRTYCGDGTSQKSPLLIGDPDEYNIALVERQPLRATTSENFRIVDARTKRKIEEQRRRHNAGTARLVSPDDMARINRCAATRSHNFGRLRFDKEEWIVTACTEYGAKAYGDANVERPLSFLIEKW